MIKNAFQDKDMLGYSDIEEMNKIFEYFPLKYINTIFSHTDLGNLDIEKIKIGDYITDNKHNLNLVKDILDNYYTYNNEQTIIFDYDDTIFSRSEEHVDISLENIKLVNNLKQNKILFTGKKISEIDNNLEIDKYFTCYGSSVYNKQRVKEIVYSSLSSEEIKEIIKVLKEIQFNFSKIENRDDCIISLRFLDEDYRNVLQEFLSLKLPVLKIIKAGKQTIDIMKKDNHKLSNFNKAFSDKSNIFYIGDEIYGNDADMIKELNSLHVKDVIDTNTFLKYLSIKNTK